MKGHIHVHSYLHMTIDTYAAHCTHTHTHSGIHTLRDTPLLSHEDTRLSA